MISYRSNPGVRGETHMGNAVWTEEQDALARLRKKEGRSFSEIAKEIGKTRNAVSGRLGRISSWKGTPVGRPAKPSAPISRNDDDNCNVWIARINDEIAKIESQLRQLNGVKEGMLYAIRVIEGSDTPIERERFLCPQRTNQWIRR